MSLCALGFELPHRTIFYGTLGFVSARRPSSIFLSPIFLSGFADRKMRLLVCFRMHKSSLVVKSSNVFITISRSVFLATFHRTSCALHGDRETLATHTAVLIGRPDGEGERDLG